MSSSEEPVFKYIEWPCSFFVFNCPRCGYANGGYDTYCDKCGEELPLWVRKENLERARKEEQKIQAEEEEQRRLYKARQEEWRREREQQTYQPPMPSYEPPQPSYTSPVFSSNDIDEWYHEDKDEDEDSDEWDEEDEEDTDEEEDYVDEPPAFVFTPSLPANTARQRAVRIVEVFMQDDNATPGQCLEFVNTKTNEHVFVMTTKNNRYFDAETGEELIYNYAQNIMKNSRGELLKSWGACGVSVESFESFFSTPASARSSSTTIPTKANAETRLKADQEPDRYQPEGGKSRLGRRVVKDTQTGAYIQTRDYVEIPHASRRQGLYILGIQRMGKSGLIENMVIQDIKQQDVGVCVLDPHGELVDNIISRLPDRAKEEKVILLDLKSKDYYSGLSLFDCADPTDDSTIMDTLSQVLHVFEKAFGITQSTPLMYDLLFKVAYVLIANPGYTMVDIPFFLTNEACRKNLLQNVTHPAAASIRAFWERWDDPKQKSSIRQREESQTILNKLNDFEHDPLRYIVGQSYSTINLQEIMDSGKILLVKLERKRKQATSLIGSILVALILNASESRKTRKLFNLYADEFQNFATEDFAVLLEQAGKRDIGITMAHQNRGQLELSEMQADANLKQRTLSVGNLVVFRAPTDADSLAGQFAQKPEEARIEIRKPQEHRRIEDEVIDEVEEDIEEIVQNPVDYLLSARAAHSSPTVQRLTHTLLDPYRQYGGAINPLLIAVMKGSVQFQTEEFVEMVGEIVVKLAYSIGWCSYGVKKIQDQKNLIDNYLTPFIDDLIFGRDYETNRQKLIEQMIASMKTTIYSKERVVYFLEHGHWSWESYARIPFVFKSIEESERYYELEEISKRNFTPEQLAAQERKRELEIRQQRIEAVEQYKQMEREQKEKEIAQDRIPERVDKIVPFVADLIALCEGLVADPIRVPTGEKRMVKRIRKQPVWLTDESERITYQQPTEQEMTNRMARELINLPLYTARVKITTAAGTEEHAIRTLEPEKGIRGDALLKRIDSIKERNIQDGYLRNRTEVEAEIRLRQGQYGEPPQEPPDEPPISRRPPR